MSDNTNDTTDPVITEKIAEVQEKINQVKEIFKDCDSTQVLLIMQGACNELLDDAELDVFYDSYDVRDDTENEDLVSVDDLLPDED